VAFAGGLVAMVARSSHDSWQDAPAVAAQALAVMDRVTPLAGVDAAAWEQALVALKDANKGAGAPRDDALERTLDAAAAVPLQITEAGADAAELAALAADRGEGSFRADAAAAAVLAAAGARAAAHLVDINLGVQQGDERLARARANEEAAAAAAARALDAAR
jgi:formiminotetrahydrofolate cyclodeaminase